MSHREIEITNKVGWLAFNEKEVELMCELLDKLDKYPVKPGTLSIAFLGEKEMCNVHKKFLNDPSPTDVITFCGDDEFGYAGEVCVSPEYARRATEEFGTIFRDELALYLIHGYLHLSGLDDIEELDRLKMREAESFCINFMRAQGTIPNFVDTGNFINL
ncbi:MAG: rRNA maturation RNase YbeY [Puniceicoccales bacterium]|jgi:probable rRNA maturation factor|nr:rRNA maturation RNase YbeY [Puniceicoccales bacterium]